MTYGCPLCGSAIPDDGRILIDLEGGLVVGGGHVANLTAQEFALFDALWSARPRTLSKEKLLNALYGLKPGGDEPEIKIIDVFICKARPKLLPLGVTVETVWGKGYRITGFGKPLIEANGAVGDDHHIAMAGAQE